MAGSRNHPVSGCSTGGHKLLALDQQHQRIEWIEELVIEWVPANASSSMDSIVIHALHFLTLPPLISWPTLAARLADQQDPGFGTPTVQSPCKPPF